MSEVQGEFRRGWKTILAAAFGASIGLTGIIFYSFGLYIVPLGNEFGWTRGQVSLGMTFITAGTVIMGPLIGIATDRYGVKKVALPSMIGLAAVLVYLSTIHQPITTYYVGCFAVAILGCATSPLTWTKAVSASFHKNRGLALGLTLLGGAAASMFGAPALKGIINDPAHGWRDAYLATAAFTALIATPVVFFLLKEPKRTADEHAAAQALLRGSTFGEAIKTGPFWLLGLGIFALIVAQSGVTIHMVPLIEDRGIANAAAIAGVMGFAIVVGRLGTGALLDRINPPAVAGITLSMPVIAVIVLALCGDHIVAIYLAVILLGLSAGAEIDLLSFFIGRYFGLKSYGKIYGALFSMFSLGNGIGAPALGWSFDKYGDYIPGLWVAAVIFAIGAAMFASLGFFKPAEDIGPAH